MADQSTQYDDALDAPPDDGGALDVDMPDVVPNGTADSLLGELKQTRKRIESEKTEHFPIPNNENDDGVPLLWGEYRLLPWRRVRQLAEALTDTRGRGQQGKELGIAAQMIAEACVGLYLRKPGVPFPASRIDLPGAADGNPMRYDDRLPLALGFEEGPKDPRKGWQTVELVRRVLVRDLAVTAHQQELLAWMEGQRRQVDEDFAGES